VDVTMSRRDFLNAAGNMCVEIQGHGAVVQMGRTSGANELITILEGSLQLYDGEKAHVFNTGDTAYLLQGDVVDWKTKAGTRLIMASYTSPD
jgi:hypothetical protein